MNVLQLTVLIPFLLLSIIQAIPTNRIDPEITFQELPDNVLMEIMGHLPQYGDVLNLALTSRQMRHSAEIYLPQMQHHRDVMFNCGEWSDLLLRQLYFQEDRSVNLQSLSDACLASLSKVCLSPARGQLYAMHPLRINAQRSDRNSRLAYLRGCFLDLSADTGFAEGLSAVLISHGVDIVALRLVTVLFDHLFDTSNVTAELQTLMKHPGNYLGHVDLGSLDLGYDGMSALKDGLTSSHNKVYALNLDSSLTVAETEILEILSTTLANPHCMLSYLRLSNNELIALEQWTPIIDALKKNIRHLKYFDIGANEISELAFAKVMELLTQPMNQIALLYAPTCRVSDNGMAVLARALRHPNNQLLYLDLAQNIFNDLSLVLLAESINHKNCKVESLDLSLNYLNDVAPVGLNLFLDTLRFNQRIWKLNIDHCRLSIWQTQSVANMMMEPGNRLKELSINHNNIGPRGAEIISQALMNPNNRLKILYSIGNEIGDEGIRHISRALSCPHCKIQSLDVSANEIELQGAIDITDTMCLVTSKLKYLHMRNNAIMNEGARALGEAIMNPNNRLEVLDIEYNHVGSNGLVYLAQAYLNPESKIRTVYMRQTFIDERVRVYFRLVQSVSKITIYWEEL